MKRLMVMLVALVLTVSCGDDDAAVGGIGIAESTDREGTILSTPEGEVYIFCHDGDQYSLYTRNEGAIPTGGLSVSYDDRRC